MNIEEIWDITVNNVIGYGSYGTVYGCTDKAGKASAIKVISIPHGDEGIDFTSTYGMTDEQTKEYYKEIVDNFENEIKLLESLKGNKNIVTIEDSKIVESDDGIGWQIFIKMELLEEFTSYISKIEITEDVVIKMAIDLCEALRVCSAKKIIHRDIKPENIFVDKDGNFKLGDFGVSKQLENTNASMSRKGTYNYMSPEVFNSKKYDSRADIYSLGIVMYRILNNNRLPFIDPEKQIVKYSEREEAFEKRMRGEKIPPLKNVSEDLNKIILRASEYKQEERFNNIEDFQDALIAIKSGNKFRFNKVTHWVKNNKIKAVIALVLVIAILSGSVAIRFNFKSKNTDDKSRTALENISENITLAEAEKNSGMQSGLYTYNDVDYVAGYNGMFYAFSKDEEKILSYQDCSAEFNIINDKIYYSVISSEEKNENGIMTASCSCWSMNLDGSDKKAILNADSDYINTIYADENSIFYLSGDHYDSECACSIYKYDLALEKSFQIYLEVYGATYLSGYIFFETSSFELLKYNIETSSYTKVDYGISYFPSHIWKTKNKEVFIQGSNNICSIIDGFLKVCNINTDEVKSFDMESRHFIRFTDDNHFISFAYDGDCLLFYKVDITTGEEEIINRVKCVMTERDSILSADITKEGSLCYIVSTFSDEKDAYVDEFRFISGDNTNTKDTSKTTYDDKDSTVLADDIDACEILTGDYFLGCLVSRDSWNLYEVKGKTNSVSQIESLESDVNEATGKDYVFLCEVAQSMLTFSDEVMFDCSSKNAEAYAFGIINNSYDNLYDICELFYGWEETKEFIDCDYDGQADPLNKFDAYEKIDAKHFNWILNKVLNVDFDYLKWDKNTTDQITKSLNFTVPYYPKDFYYYNNNYYYDYKLYDYESFSLDEWDSVPVSRVAIAIESSSREKNHYTVKMNVEKYNYEYVLETVYCTIDANYITDGGLKYWSIYSVTLNK